MGTVFSLVLSPAVTAAAIDLNYPDHPLDVGQDVFGTPNSFSPGLNVNLSGNNVTVTSTPVDLLTGNVFGGQSGTPGIAVFNNNVIISGGVIGDAALGVFRLTNNQPDPELVGGGLSAGIPIKGGMFGGVSTDADSYGHTLTITGGDIKGAAIGGFVRTGTGNVYDNRVFVSGGSVAYELNGATTDSGDATNNRVTISGGQFAGSGGVIPRIYGGITESGLAQNNTVIVSGLASPPAMATRALYGGGSILGSVDGNNLIITNTPGFQAYALSGGFGGEKTLGRTATNNTVSLIDLNNFEIATWIRGGRLLDGGSGTDGMNDGNTLNFIRSGGRTGGIAFFENYNFYLPSTLTTAAPLVTITGATPVDLTGAIQTGNFYR